MVKWHHRTHTHTHTLAHMTATPNQPKIDISKRERIYLLHSHSTHNLDTESTRCRKSHSTHTQLTRGIFNSSQKTINASARHQMVWIQFSCGTRKYDDFCRSLLNNGIAREISPKQLLQVTQQCAIIIEAHAVPKTSTRSCLDVLESE